MKKIVYILLCIPAVLFGQTNETETDTLEYEYIIIKGDSIPRTSIDLDEVMLLNRLQFDSREDRRRYLILRRKTIKVYPYAKLAAERLETLNKRLSKMTRKRDRDNHQPMSYQKYKQRRFQRQRPNRQKHCYRSRV